MNTIKTQFVNLSMIYYINVPCIYIYYIYVHSIHICMYITFNICNAYNYRYIKSKKVKSSMVRSLPVENLLPQNVGSVINYMQ